MAKASDNPFPSVRFVEGASPATPAVGEHRIFVDSADGHLKRIDDAGIVTDVEITGGGGGGPIDSGAVLTKSTTQSIPASTATAVTFDGEAEDTDAYHSTASNTSRLTAPANGVYIVTASAELASVLDNVSVILRIRKNGVDADGDGRARIITRASVTAFPAPSFTRRVRMNAGDYVEAIIEHNDSAARSVRESTNGTSFTITRIA